MKYMFMRYPGGKPKAVTFSYDDGVAQDRRLSELFHQYGLKATFNLNCDRPGKRSPSSRCNYTGEEIKEIFFSKGHEVAVHGAFHRANGNIRPIEGIREVLACRLELEEKCDTIIRGMAYPDTGINQMGSFGTYAQIKNYLTELDIAYARSLGGDNDSFLLPEDFHAWVPTAHHTNPNLPAYVDKFLDINYSKMYYARAVPRLLYIWGHSYEFDRDENWDFMEEICAKLAHKDEIWYATNIEICDYVEAYKRLRYSADGNLVYNPTLFTIWFEVDGKSRSIEPGQTLRIEG